MKEIDQSDRKKLVAVAKFFKEFYVNSERTLVVVAWNKIFHFEVDKNGIEFIARIETLNKGVV
jgi:hypothetical protein